MKNPIPLYIRNHEEAIGYNNIEPSSQMRYEDYFTENIDKEMKIVVDGFINTLNAIQDNATVYSKVKTLVEDSAKALWDEAIRFLQSKNNATPDDRPLYWARIKMLVALRGHPYFSREKNNTDLDYVVKCFEEKSRNFTGADFSRAPSGVMKVLITGFDPFILRSNVEQWNPSGQAALSLHGTKIGNGYIQSMVFPVRYADFDKGVVEKYLLPHINNIDMIITISQGRLRYDIERFASKFRTRTIVDNLNVVKRRISYLPNAGIFSQTSEELMPEFLETTLPVKFIIPGSLGNTRVVYNQGYKGSRTSASYSMANSGTNNIPEPSKNEIALGGSGGTYLSNEIFYRVAVLRNHLNLDNVLKSGHLHVPKIAVNDLKLAQLGVTNIKTIIEHATQGN